jgi:hypothetical protein
MVRGIVWLKNWFDLSSNTDFQNVLSDFLKRRLEKFILSKTYLTFLKHTLAMEKSFLESILVENLINWRVSPVPGKSSS